MNFFPSPKRTGLHGLLLISLLALTACPPPKKIEPEKPTPKFEPLKCADNTTVNASVAGEICGKRESVPVTDETGETTRQVRAYLGIPYADDTSGKNRWQPPNAKAKFATKYEATRFGPECPQVKDQEVYGSEDCLSLNIWVPDGAKPEDNKAVMLWIHGGAFLFGASWTGIYDGAYTAAAEDVIVVSINYRLGVFGFLAGGKPLLSDQNLPIGNYGLRDQQLAMEWVQDNIEDFGGDKGNVTLFGESAGAMSVALHLASIDSSEKLFQQAIMESNVLGLPYKTNTEAWTLEGALATKLDCHHLFESREKYMECMRGKDMSEVVIKSFDVIQDDLTSLLVPHIFHVMVWSPTIDGEFVKGQPLQNLHDGEVTKPYISGTNHDEGLLFTGAANIAPEAYETIVALLFPLGTAGDILKTPPYIPQTAWLETEGTASEGAGGKADSKPNNNIQAGSLITDFAFVCGNKWGMDGGSGKRWGYSFDLISNYNPLCPEGENSETCKNKPCNHAVCHSFEIPYVFHSFDKLEIHPPVVPTADELALSAMMNRYWTRFAKTGDPNGGTDPNWPEYTKDAPKRLQFNKQVTETTEFMDRNCDDWDKWAYETRNYQVTAIAAPAP